MLWSYSSSSNSGYLSKNDTFQSGVNYVVGIAISLKNGFYKFGQNPTLTINGKPAPSNCTFQITTSKGVKQGNIVINYGAASTTQPADNPIGTGNIFQTIINAIILFFKSIFAIFGF